MSAKIWPIEAISEAELNKLAAWLSLVLKKTDIIFLKGDLGAGKTTFARALIRHLSNDEIVEIPSPTFSLVQHYQTARVDIYHFDLYRISHPDEVVEIGLDEALISGVSIIEWPDRLDGQIGADYLEISFDEADNPDERRLTIAGHGAWAARIQRLEHMLRFVEKSDWGSAFPRYMQGDASARAYARLPDPARPAILMNAPAQTDGPPLRDGKPYSRIAHLSEDVRAFTAIASYLRQAGFRAPKIYAQDLDDGFIILQDMGDQVFGSEIENGRPIGELYRPAVNLLVEMRQTDVPDCLPISRSAPYSMPQFDQAAFLIEAELLIDWYWPAIKSQTIPDEKRRQFVTLQKNAFAKIDGRDFGWMLRDFHSPNLIWLNHAVQKEPFKHVGIIDFQDALRGPRSYDLVSLLQDARLDVPEDLEVELLSHYCVQAGTRETEFNEEQFRLSYAILGAQRNTKILGIFARLAIRDKKHAYLRHMPIIWNYLERNLAHLELNELKNWFDDNFPKDVRQSSINIERHI